MSAAFLQNTEKIAVLCHHKKLSHSTNPYGWAKHWSDLRFCSTYSTSQKFGCTFSFKWMGRYVQTSGWYCIQNVLLHFTDTLFLYLNPAFSIMLICKCLYMIHDVDILQAYECNTTRTVCCSLPKSPSTSVPSSGGSAASRSSSSSLMDGSFLHCWMIFFLNVVGHLSRSLPDTPSPNIRTKSCSTWVGGVGWQFQDFTAN